MASPCIILQRSNPSLLQQNALDGVPLCFMLRRFSRPNRARGEVLEYWPPQADERASSQAGMFLLKK